MHLRDQGFLIELVNVGRAAHNKERFANAKAEHYWGLRERLQAGELAGLTDDQTIAQLGAIRWHTTSQGKIAIENKEELLRRGVKSPDRAEALMLAFAEDLSFATARRQVEWLIRSADAEARGERILSPAPNPVIELQTGDGGMQNRAKEAPIPLAASVCEIDD
jgi:hypothetical protein